MQSLGKEYEFEGIFKHVLMLHILLYRNIAISCSNIDFRIVGKISRFTDAPVYRCSPTAVEC